MKGSDFVTDDERRAKKKEYLSISQIAKYKNIKPDTLRFYDKIGLFKPDYIDPVNDRRYYSPEQCDKLGTIMELRSMQISIKDIMEFMDNRTLDKSETILKTQLGMLSKEIAQKQQLKLLLEEKLDFIAKQRKKEFELDKPILKTFPKRYAMFGEPGTTSSTKVAMDYMELEKEVAGLSPIFASNKIAMEIPSKLNGNVHNEIIRPMIFCTNIGNTKKVQEISGGKYACIYIKDAKGNLEEKIDSLKRLARKDGYELGETGFLIYQIDITLTDDINETLIELQFPLK